MTAQPAISLQGSPQAAEEALAPPGGPATVDDTAVASRDTWQ